jgi:hypothetical protein
MHGAAKVRKGDSSPLLELLFAATRTITEVAPPALMSSITNALGVETRIMGLKGALKLRRNQALTLYRVDAWDFFLH